MPTISDDGAQVLITGDAAADVLARIDALHTALSHIVLEGGDLQQIAAETAAVLGVEVAFTSTDGRERASVLTDDAREALAGARLVDTTGRLRVERVQETGLPLDGGEVRCLRVAAGGADLARLVCLRLGRPVAEEDVHALERVAIVAALLITRQSAIGAVENKYQGDFLRDLLVRGVVEEAYVAEHAEAFGWSVDRPSVVVVAEIDPQPREEKPASREQKRAWQERFAAAWRQVTHALDPGVPTVDFSSEVVALLPVADGDRSRGPATTPYAAWSPASRATRAAAGAASPSASAGSRRRWRTCPRPTPRPGARSRSAGACTARAPRRPSTSSACTG